MKKIIFYSFLLLNIGDLYCSEPAYDTPDSALDGFEEISREDALTPNQLPQDTSVSSAPYVQELNKQNAINNVFEDTIKKLEHRINFLRRENSSLQQESQAKDAAIKFLQNQINGIEKTLTQIIASRKNNFFELVKKNCCKSQRCCVSKLFSCFDKFVGKQNKDAQDQV